MCFFITLAVPAEHAVSVARSAVRPLAMQSQANPSIAKEFGDRAKLVLTSGGCSCDLYVPKREDGGASRELSAARRKYTKLGWSAAKIAKALAARDTSADRRRDFVGLRNDARELIARVAEEAGEIGLLVHAYSGDLDEETVSATQGGVSTPDDLRTGTTNVPENVLLWIRPARS